MLPIIMVGHFVVDPGPTAWFAWFRRRASHEKQRAAGKPSGSGVS
jgi:hypothetical protein